MIKKKDSEGFYWPVTSNIEFDAGKIVWDAMSDICNSLELRFVCSISDYFVSDSKEYKKYKNIPGFVLVTGGQFKDAFDNAPIRVFPLENIARELICDINQYNDVSDFDFEDLEGKRTNILSHFEELIKTIKDKKFVMKDYR